MRRRLDRQERLAGFFVVVGAAFVFASAIWFMQRWSEAVARDPAEAWGARWLAEHLTAHPYLTAGAVLFSIALSSGVIMLLIVRVAKRLAARLAGRGRSPVSGGREEDLGP